MSHGFKDADFSKLAEIYNGFAPPKYRIDAELLRLKTVENPVFDWGASCIEDDHAFIAVKRSAASLYKGPFQDIAHVTILGFNDPHSMIDRMNETKRCLRDRGVQELFFGTDTGHFFPGVPTDFPALRDFLIIGGFTEGGEAHDMERDLKDYECKVPIPAGDVFRPLVESDLPELDSFLGREFTGRWRYDVIQKAAAEGPGTVFGLFVEDKCEGFALLQWDPSKLPIGGAVWRNDLGEHWGSLGPIGVSAHLRGRGSGNALLGKALEHLRDKGTRRCIIDWTGLVDFYGAHGFEVTRTYRYMSLDLEASR
jgi:GNAT superfamily N-acetyltransferase